MTTATELFTPSDHAQWADDTALRATATSWCQQLWCYLGRPISVERVAAAARADGRSEARVTLRIVGTDRTTWNTHEAGAVDEDPGVATASAVFAAVSQADPITVPLWNLDTLGHIVAATALDDGHERPNIGPEAEVERLRHLLEALKPGSRVRVRTRHGAYRAVHGTRRQLALSVVDRPEALAAVDEWLSALSGSSLPVPSDPSGSPQ